jgi:acyl-CoA hydrolase
MPKQKLPRAKSVRESQSEMTQVVLPNDANPLGSILGGTVMHWVDLVGAIAAHRHSGSYVVTASVDHMDFHLPIRIGQLVILKSSVNRVFRSSMEVGVKVFREEIFTGLRQHTTSAYLTFVAIDKEGKPQTVPQVAPETAEEKRRYREAGNRRQWRIAQLGGRTPKPR